jgi:hypothetical protein
MITIGCPCRINPASKNLDFPPILHESDHFLEPEPVIGTTVETDILSVNFLHFFQQRIDGITFTGRIDHIKNIMDMDSFHILFF